MKESAFSYKKELYYNASNCEDLLNFMFLKGNDNNNNIF